jgi:hypothetical protein
MRDDPFHGSPYFRRRAFYLRATADARADAQRCRAWSDSTTASPPAVLLPRRQKDPSHAHMLTALAEVNDERWYLCGKAAVLGVRVKRRLMSEHPGRYGRVSPARILELLPNGGSGRRYKEDLLFTTHEIDRKIVGSEGGAWFGAVRDHPAPARRSNRGGTRMVSRPRPSQDRAIARAVLQLQLLVGAHGWRTPSSGRTTIRTLSEECILEYYFGHCQGIMPSASHSSVRALMHGPKPLATPSLLPFLDPLAPRRLRNAPAYCAAHGWEDWAWGNTLALRRHQRRPDAFSR